MAKVRLEWVRPSRPGFQRGSSDGFAVFSGQQTFTVSSTAVRSATAPAFTGADAATNGQGMARVTVLAGAVIVLWGGPSPTVTESTGVRLEVGQTQLLSVDTGDALSFLEAQDAPSQRFVQDATAETALSAIQTTLQAPLAVLASPIHAVATARAGTLTTANAAQDLMPANTARNGWTIQNQSNGALYIRSKGVAGTNLATLDQNSLIIPPGAAYDPPKVSPHAVSIIGATAGQAFFAEEW